MATFPDLRVPDMGQAYVSSSDSESEFEGPVLIDTDNGNDDDAECIFCLGLFSQDKCGEQWAQCTQCKKWGHCDCAGNSDNVNSFVTYALMVKSISGRDMPSHVIQMCNSHNKLVGARIRTTWPPPRNTLNLLFSFQHSFE
jgi:hypothetical protein